MSDHTMSDHTPTPKLVTEHSEEIPGYTYGTGEAAVSPLTLEDLERLKAVVGLTPDDEQALIEAARVLADQADDMVTAYRKRLGELPFMRAYSGYPDGTPNPAYGAASKPRFDRFIIDACTRPLDQDWLNYQHEIGLRHPGQEEQNRPRRLPRPHPDALPARLHRRRHRHRPRLSRRRGASAEQVDRMHAAFTKSVMLHVTVWTRPYVAAADW
ncbi:protoglobin domain-containing protein [Streptosporangium lutulentum]